MRLFSLLIVCAQFASAQTADIKSVAVIHDDGEYKINFEVTLNAEYESVWNLLKMHNRMQELSPAIMRSDIQELTIGKSLLDIDLKACWFFICKTLNKVSHVDSSVEGRLSYRTVEGKGDFEMADETLSLESVNAKTILSYEASLIPSVYIPPLIGPYAVRKAIESELKITAENTERLANE